MSEDDLVEAMRRTIQRRYLKAIPSGSMPTDVADEVARAALAVVREREGWQPIETAPRDGTVVDLWCVLEDGDDFARITGCAFRIWESIDSGIWEDGDGTDFEAEGWIATHWRPLPAPPEDAGE